jgi:hypothetical protein
LTNILLYLGITTPLIGLTSMMVRTGKLAPRSIVNFLNRAGAMSGRGKIGFDVTKVPGFNEVKGLSSAYNAFKCFADASAAVVGGIISSNIITPIVRNKIAAYRQNKFKQERNAKLMMTEVSNPVPRDTVAQRGTYISTPSHRFEDYKRHVLSI